MSTLEEAKNMINKINVRAKVIDKTEPRTVNKKDGGTIDVCDATLEDESGTMKFTLWGDDIPKVSVGDTVEITNGFTNTFKGEVSLQKGKFGQMEVITS